MSGRSWRGRLAMLGLCCCASCRLDLDAVKLKRDQLAGPDLQGRDGPPGRQVITVAGTGAAGWKDGDGASAKFHSPRALALFGSWLYVADTGNHCIRRVDLGSGQVTTFAGHVADPPEGGLLDGSSQDARFNEPRGLAVTSAGVLYVADSQNHCIRRVDAAGQVSTFAGCRRGTTDGNRLQVAAFDTPTDVLVVDESLLTLYVAESGNHCIRQIQGDQVVQLAGLCGTAGYADSSNLLDARFRGPTSVRWSPGGDAVIVGDTDNHVLRALGSAGISTLAGSGDPGFADQAALSAMFNRPSGFAPGVGGLLIADSLNHRIRRLVGPTGKGQVDTFAGSGQEGFLDGPVLAARFDLPSDVIVDTDGRIYVADTENHRIRYTQ